VHKSSNSIATQNDSVDAGPSNAPTAGRRPRTRPSNNLILRRKKRAALRRTMAGRARALGQLATAPVAAPHQPAAGAGESETDDNEYSTEDEWGPDPEHDDEIQYAHDRPERLREYHPRERRGRHSFQFQNSGHALLRFRGLTVRIMRVHDQRSSVFSVADSLFMLRFTQNPDADAEPLSVEDTHNILSEALLLALRWLAEDYGEAAASEMYARIQLHESGGREMDASLDQTYFMSGVFRLNNYAQLVRQTLAACQRSSQSNYNLRLHRGLLVYVSILSRSDVERIEENAKRQTRKRQAENADKRYGRNAGDAAAASGSFRNWTNRWAGNQRGRGGRKKRAIGGGGKQKRHLAGGGNNLEVPASIFGYFTSLNYFKIPRDIEELQNYCLPASLLISHYLSQKRYVAYLKKMKRPIPSACSVAARKYDKIHRALVKYDPLNDWVRKTVHKFVLEIRQFCRNGNFPSTGPYEIEPMLKYASQVFRANIIVFSSQGNLLKYCFPSRQEVLDNQLMHKRPQYVLYEECTSPDAISHISIIKKPAAFFRKTGYQCFLCLSRVARSNSHNKHVCRMVPWQDKCKACRLIRLDGDERTSAADLHYVDITNYTSYCIEEERQQVGADGTVAASQWTCPLCSESCRSKMCLQAHKTRCEKSLYCPKCNMRIHVRQKDKQMAMEAHICNQKLCKICWVSYSTTDGTKHSCLLSGAREFSYLPRLCFWDLESRFQTSSVSGCQQCTLLETEYMLRERLCLSRIELRKALDRATLETLRCDEHKGLGETADDLYNTHVPVLVVLYFESQERETFSRVVFSSPELGIDDCVIEENVLTVRYLPDELRGQTEVLNRTKFSTGFEKSLRFSKDAEDSEKRRALDKKRQSDLYDSLFGRTAANGKRSDFVTLQELKSSNLSAMSKFVQFTVNPVFKSHCFISCNTRSYDGSFLLSTLLRYGISPRLVANGRKLMNIAIPSLDISYTCSLNYLPEGVAKLPARFGLETPKYLFPVSTLGQFERYVNYIGPLPPDDMYLTFRDTEEAIAEKRAYLAQQREQNAVFHFVRELLEYCIVDTEILLKACLKYTEESFDLQRILRRTFNTPVPPGKLEFISPFGCLVTLPSYSYNLFKQYGMPQGVNVYALDSEGGPRIQTSFGEMECALFLESYYPDSIVYSQYTSARPKRLGQYTPDVLVEQADGTLLVVEFSGCAIRCHQAKGCSYQADTICDENMPNFLGQSANDFRRYRKKRDDVLMRQFNVSRVLYVWECVWTRLKTGGANFIDAGSETEAYRAELAIEAELACGNNEALRELVDLELLLDEEFRRKVRAFFALREEQQHEAVARAAVPAVDRTPVGVSASDRDGAQPSAQAPPLDAEPPTNSTTSAAIAAAGRANGDETCRRTSSLDPRKPQRLRPKERLSARLCMRGGRTESFFTDLNMENYPDYNLYYVDMISLYPAVAMQSDLFPVEEQRVLISQDDISRLEFKPQSREEGNAEEECGWGLFYKDPTCNDEMRKVHGAIQCKVLPPCPRTSTAMTVQYPVLGVTIGDKSMRVLCNACGQLGSRKPCTHTDDERCLVSTWTVLDILVALGNDYKVVEIYEVYAYFTTAALFRDYISLVSSFKLRYEGIPSDIRGDRAAELEYCRTINEKMGFKTPGIMLTPEMMCANEGQRNHCKTLLNSLL
jgi:hypothetical protein